MDSAISEKAGGGHAPTTSWRSAFYFILFILISCVVHMQAALYAAKSSWGPAALVSKYSQVVVPVENPHKIVHPIPQLMMDNERKYREKVAKQSKTLGEAVVEYEHRYGRPPPKGFDDWFNYAKENNFTMMDEFDGLVEDLKAFWSLSGKELRSRALQASQLPSIAIAQIKDGNASVMDIPGHFSGEANSRAKGFTYQLKPFMKKLPDMMFPINGKAECRVLVAWENQRHPNLTEQDSSKGVEAMLGGPFKEAWNGEGSVWSAFRRVCSPHTESRRLYSSIRYSLHGSSPVNHLEEVDPSRTTLGEDFQFAKDVDKDFDYCENPWAHVLQGHFFSDFRTIPKLYPIFSYGRGQGYMDIQIPSHYYFTPSAAYTYGWDTLTNKVHEWDNMEVPWEQKSNAMFWRGTPRGGNTPKGFMPQYHRHRFNRMTNDRNEDSARSVVFRNPVTNEFVQERFPVQVLNEIMDIGFTSTTQGTGYPGGLEALYRDHRFAATVPLGESWKHRYLVDLDGVGYSARFFALLASNSVPVKTTVYKEFFSHWIQPWVHYIPLSQSYHELYNIHAFFNGPTEAMLSHANITLPVANDTLSTGLSTRGYVDPEGDRLLRRIARAGRIWKRKNGRRVDIHVFSYRLCLEWARLWADDRESMNYILPKKLRTKVKKPDRNRA